MMVTFSEKLDVTGYWKQLGISLLWLVVVSGGLFWLLDIQNAEIANASTRSQTLAMIFGSLYFASIIYFVGMVVSAVYRRAVDVGNPILWTAVGLLMPLGILLIGFRPSQE